MFTNNDDTQKRVALYLRVSTEDQKEKYGVELQREAILGLLKSKGRLPDGRDRYVLAGDKHIYTDDGISGTTPRTERPGFSRLIEDLTLAEHKPFDVVAVYKIDRFARRLKILLDIIDFFDKYEVLFISANESIDTSTPFGKAMLGIIGVIAELEIETTKQRTQDGRAEAIKQGVWMGGSIPFGYIKDQNGRLTILKPEAEVVDKIYHLFVHENYSVQQIANYLTKHEYLSPDASSIHHQKRRGTVKKKNELTFWRAEKVAYILSDEVYLGFYYYGKNVGPKRVPKSQWKLSPYRHEAIIDEYIYKLAQRKLTERGQYATKLTQSPSKHTYLLSGLLRCSDCRKETILFSDLPTWVGLSKKVKSTGKHSYYYHCGNTNGRKTSDQCHVLPLPAEPIEKYVVNYIRKLLENPIATFEYQEQLRSKRLELKQLRSKKDDLAKLVAGAPERIKRIKEQHELGIIKTEELTSRIKDQEEKLTKYKAELQLVEQRIGKARISEHYIQTLDLFSKKYTEKLNDIYENRDEVFEILHMLIDGIVVHARRPKIGEKIPGRPKSGSSKDTKAANKDYDSTQLKILPASEAAKLSPKTDQRVPDEIDIYLKLPQQILIELSRKEVLHEEEFAAFSADL